MLIVCNYIMHKNENFSFTHQLRKKLCSKQICEIVSVFTINLSAYIHFKHLVACLTYSNYCDWGCDAGFAGGYERWRQQEEDFSSPWFHRLCLQTVGYVNKNMGPFFLSFNNNNHSICKAQNLVHKDSSKCIHTQTHRGTRTYERSDYTNLNLHILRWAASRGFRRMKTAAWNRKHGRSTVWEKEMFTGCVWMSHFLVIAAQSRHNINSFFFKWSAFRSVSWLNSIFTCLSSFVWSMSQRTCLKIFLSSVNKSSPWYNHAGWLDLKHHVTYE